MLRLNGTLPYHCYHATNATNACIGCVPTVPTPLYRCVGQFANTESISAAGELHTPIIVLKTATLLEKWIVNELADDTMLLYSESGYSNDDINLKWVKHFDRATQRKIQGVFRLLILDGFSSHIKYDFVKYAQHFKIILFGLPPHTTHFLQPLDMVCFQPLKHYHAEAIDTAVRTGDTTFSKIEFLTAFKEFRKQAFKQDTILSAFSKTDIIPHNPSKVLIPLQQRVDAHYRALNIEGHSTIIEEMEHDTSSEPTTPINIAELH
jgi:DDE superfamily endonuclease